MKLLLIPISLVIALIILVTVVDFKVENNPEAKTEKVELGHSYRNGSIGIKMNDVQCLNTSTGQIEICY